MTAWGHEMASSALADDRWRTAMIGAGITALAGAFGLDRIGVPSPWHDEVATLVSVERSWGSFAAMLGRVDLVHGAFYALERVVAALGGSSFATLRTPSAVAIALCAGFTFAVGRRLFGLGPGLVAGLVLPSLPWALWASSEARSPALAMLGATVIVWSFLSAVPSASWRRWWAYAAALAFFSWIFVFTVLLIPVLGLSLACDARFRAGARRFVVSSAVALVTTVPLIVGIVQQRGQVAWIPRTDPTNWTALGDVVVGGGLPERWVGVPAVVGALALIGWALARPSVVEGTGTHLFTAVLVVGWAVFPPTTLYLAGAAQPLFVGRYVALATPALALLIAALPALVEGSGSTVLRLTGLLIGVQLVALCLGLAAPRWDAQRRPAAKERLHQVAAAVAAVRRPGDAVWYADASGTDRTARIVAYAYPTPFAGTTDLTLKTSYEAAGTLWSTSRPLQTATLSRTSRIIAVAYRPDLPAGRLDGDLALLRRAGFREVSRANVQLWRVLVLERTPARGATPDR